MNYTKEELYKHSGELLELIEDIVAYYCDENRISGELAYTIVEGIGCLLYTSPSPRDTLLSRMPSSA